MTPIADYGMIGDCETAALVSRSGSIDWLCLPRFDGGACFAALLGTPEHGRWLLAPRHRARITRRYRGDSLILDTIFSCKGGRVRVTDFMVPGSENRTVVRLVEGLSGRVAMAMDLVIRFDYGESVPWVRKMDSKTTTAIAGPHMVVLRTPIALAGANLRTQASFTVSKGERVPFVLSYGSSHLECPPVYDADIELERVTRYWASWAARCNIEQPWRACIMRSLLTLKGLSYQPTGGIVAAPTTSLPETLGGPRNWDYRYCWLRDATFTLLAFLNAGYTEEADVWQHWLSRAVAGAPEQLQIMYSVLGERRLVETELTHLPGFAGSKPVRIGNAAAQQLQLDVYGELASTMTVAREAGLTAPPESVAIRRILMRHLQSIWRKPDEGIWEIRGPRQHFVHSKVMAWVAFDRVSRSPTVTAAERTRYARLAGEIHRDVCAHGIDKKRGCFVQAYGSDRLDASLLMLPLVGFLPANDRRIKTTVREIERTLLKDGLVRRYETQSGIDALPPGEGAFLACSFWLVDAYAQMGRKAAARRLFDRLANLANEVGLLSEEYDPMEKIMLGNFPQAFSHVALINSAIGLMRSARKTAKRSRALDIAHPRRHRSAKTTK